MSTPYPLKNFLTLLENVLTSPENFPCNSYQFSTLSRKIPTPCEKFSIPPEKIVNPLPPKIFLTLLENVLTSPENFPCNHPENLFKATE